MFHGGTVLSKFILASEAHSIRNKMPRKYQRISKPVPMMRVEYDVVVVGSGYGGAVAASRMARAGKSVCLLELGKERWPGEYPVDLVKAVEQLHVSGEVFKDDAGEVMMDKGDPTGLYHLIVGDGQNAFVANGTLLGDNSDILGLGGTSLLNANVFLKADNRTLSQGVFPPEIRKDPGSLDKCTHHCLVANSSDYTRAESVLQPQPYPKTYPPLNKLNVLEEQAGLLGEEYSKRFYRVPQTTTFEDGLNNMGVEQSHSSLSGQDATGVNDGSKNSTLMNYLPDAWNRGAEMYPQM
jgi:choline dehydrogenase-like flavoprotein